MAGWPDALKSAEIKPIFKDGNKHKLNNYSRFYSFIKKKLMSENQLAL